MSFRNCSIAGVGIKPWEYNSAQQVRGDAGFVISSSALRKFAACPDKWRRGAKESDTDATEYGNLFEVLVLQYSRFDERYIVRPETYMHEVLRCPQCGSVTAAAKCQKCKIDRVRTQVTEAWSPMSDTCKEWKQQKEDEGLIVLTPEQLQDAADARKRLMEDAKLKAFVHSCDVQVHVVGEWQDDNTGLVIPCQCLIDLVPLDNSEFAACLGDLKTIRCASPQAWRKDSSQRGYHIQAAWNLDMWNAATGQNRDKFCFVISENSPPWQPAREMLTFEETTPGKRSKLEIGRILYQSMIADYAACLKTGEWPGYDDHEDSVDGWTLDRASDYDQMDADRMLQKKSRVEPPIPY